MAYVYGRGIAKDEAEGVKWLRKSADQGNAGGQFWLGVAYYSGIGVAKDYAEAVRWYRKAADQGSAHAQYNLGLAFQSGAGVRKDDVEAYFWINIAASSLDQALVRQSRDNVAKSLTASELSEVQERCRKWEEAHPNNQSPP